MTVQRFSPIVWRKVAVMDLQEDGNYVRYEDFLTLLARFHQLEVENTAGKEQKNPPYNPDYQSLRSVLNDAYEQAASGKGKERHARGNPFEKQHMQTISGLLDSDRGMAFQAIKKLTEGLDLPDPDARKRELLGAINYVAGIIIFHHGEK